MSNPTSNYGFVMPTSTDLVTDLPADFAVFGQAVDTQMKTNADAAIAKTIVDAKGDLIAATAADTVSRLAVGTDGQALVADSTAATGIKWAAVGGNKTISVISSGSLPTGASSLTLNSLSSYDSLYLIVENAKWATSNSYLQTRINSDTGSNYRTVVGQVFDSGPYGNAGAQVARTSMITSPADYFGAFYSQRFSSGETFLIELTNAKAAGVTNMRAEYVYDWTNRESSSWEMHSGYYNSAAAVSSLTISVFAGTNFTAGSYILLGG